jgi:hypothetical protein
MRVEAVRAIPATNLMTANGLARPLRRVFDVMCCAPLDGWPLNLIVLARSGKLYERERYGSFK